nr:hypothetical protein HUO10_000468 [Paraburkholderia busanensis]
MFFDELSNDEWALLAALVSDEPAVRLNRRGRPRAEPRIVANAVLWILTTGEPWSKLPGRYPSGPTCRRRFEEWQLNGTLLEMVRLLSQTGRTFAYVPQPAPPVAARPAAAPAAAATPSVRDETLRGVSWKSPESWQAPGVSGSLSNWRSADPIADITRQLAGFPQAPDAHASSPASQVAQTPATRTPSRPFAPAVRVAPRAEVQRAEAPLYGEADEAGAVGIAMQRLDAAIASARRAYPEEDSRSPLSMSLAPRGTQIEDPRGYVILVAAEQVPNAMYRAWAEIMKDGRRVERSGLVGPRFADADDAQRHALDWAHQWIERECAAMAGRAVNAVNATGDATKQAAVQEHAHKPVQQPSQEPVHASPPTRALPAIRHVPEPVTIHHGAPLHGPLHAFRGPLRRYPGEPMAAAVSVGTSTEGTTTERYPSSYPEFISHVG